MTRRTLVQGPDSSILEMVYQGLYWSKNPIKILIYHSLCRKVGSLNCEYLNSSNIWGFRFSNNFQSNTSKSSLENILMWVDGKLLSFKKRFSLLYAWSRIFNDSVYPFLKTILLNTLSLIFQEYMLTHLTIPSVIFSDRVF